MSGLRAVNVAWVLNLGAELELDRRTPSEALRRHADRWRRSMRMPTGDVVLDIDEDARAEGLEGRCWCPTPRALARLRLAGARVPDAPPVDVLRRVNERGFAHSLCALPDAVRCCDAPCTRAAVSRRGRWLMVRALSFAGRGQRRVDSGRLGESDEAWLRGVLTQGPVYVLPRVDIELEVSLHGLLGDSLRTGKVVVSGIDRHGQWQRTRLEVGELRDIERRALHETFDRVADALRGAGYFGPFGIDAFRYDGGFHPLSDINARYTMGWSLGMGGWS